MLIGSESPCIFGNAHKLVTYFSKYYNIKHIINLTSQCEEYHIDGLKEYHVPVYDLPFEKDMKQLFNIIEKGLSRKEPVWIHCERGIDRTGCVIGSYLVYKGYNPEEVIEELLDKFKNRIQYPYFYKLWEDKIAFIHSFV